MQQNSIEKSKQSLVRNLEEHNQITFPLKPKNPSKKKFYYNKAPDNKKLIS